ncbi:hypothetical protein [Rhizobium sp. No.120]
MASTVFITTKELHRGNVGARRGKRGSWPARLFEVVLGYFSHRWNRLDIEEVPDSVKRDLGFLDGCAPYREEDRMH